MILYITRLRVFVGTVFITGYTGRVPERQKDEDERMEETREQGEDDG